VQHLEKVRLAELIGDDERAVAFLEQQIQSIRRRIANKDQKTLPPSSEQFI
jgi:hypothetical protein